MTDFGDIERELEIRVRQQAREACIQGMRDAIWRLADSDQLEGLLRSIRDGLRTLDVDFFGISINHVDRQRS